MKLDILSKLSKFVDEIVDDKNLEIVREYVVVRSNLKYLKRNARKVLLKKLFYKYGWGSSPGYDEDDIMLGSAWIKSLSDAIDSGEVKTVKDFFEFLKNRSELKDKRYWKRLWERFISDVKRASSEIRNEIDEYERKIDEFEGHEIIKEYIELEKKYKQEIKEILFGREFEDRDLIDLISKKFGSDDDVRSYVEELM